MALELRPANLEDWEEEFRAIKSLPAEEKFRVVNEHYNASKREFREEILPLWIANSKGEQLKPSRVPSTTYFLWDGDHIVSKFNFRHRLNDALRDGGGHVGYATLPNYRGQGYASKGLKLLIDIAKDIVPEDELYLSADKGNSASIQVMLDNGAYIHHEGIFQGDERHAGQEMVFARIPLNKSKEQK